GRPGDASWPSSRVRRRATRPVGGLVLASLFCRRVECLAVCWRLELVQVPVSDVDRAKSFYTEKAGFNADHDHRVSDEIRFVQLTPPGSACSIALGTGLGTAAAGSVQGLQPVVSGIDAARAEPVGRRGGRSD